VTTYKIAVFDMDGTILNTIDDIRDAVNEILRRHAYAERTLPQILHAVGNGAAHLMEESLPDGRDTADFEAILREYEAYYEAHCEIRTAPYPGIPELLGRLKEAGIRLAVVSNKGDGAVKALNERYFAGAFESAVGQRPGVRRKPAPDAVFEALQAFGSDGSDAIYIGDSEVDIATARAAGIPVIAVTWGFRTRELIESLEPDYLADTPQQVEKILLS